jgi:phospholipid/cholesterol/gamma-HCH transport system substrate-binding protein
MSERTFRILAGLVTLIFLMSATVFGVMVANGALRDVYQLNASFAAAGQGLMQQSDVKIHGVNIGKVSGVKLENGRALVRMEIDQGEQVPVNSRAIIRPKTLFGEKFVDIDPGDQELEGPFLGDEGTIKDTLGGFELEKILTDLYPILKVVKPQELTTLLNTLAEGGENLGPNVNRTIVNFGALADVQARHAEDTQQFLDDLALLSGELADRSDDLVAGAKRTWPPCSNRRRASPTTPPTSSRPTARFWRRPSPREARRSNCSTTSGPASSPS